MDITEEAVRRRQTLLLEDPESTYPEIKDLLERRIGFDHVSEERYYHDIDKGTIRSRIKAVEHFDENSKMELDIYLVIRKDSRELDLQIKGKLITHYDTEGWKNSLWYYGYRALYDKFLYGTVREHWEEPIEEKVEELLTRVRQNVEGR